MRTTRGCPRHLKVLQFSNDTGEGMSSLHSHGGPEDVFIKLTACRYCAHSNEDYVEYLLSEDKVIYMNFLDWMSRTSREKRLQTYDEYWRRLCQYSGLFARRPVNHPVHEQMRRVCLSFLFHSYTGYSIDNSTLDESFLQRARSAGARKRKARWI